MNTDEPTPPVSSPAPPPPAPPPPATAQASGAIFPERTAFWSALLSGVTGIAASWLVMRWLAPDDLELPTYGFFWFAGAFLIGTGINALHVFIVYLRLRRRSYRSAGERQAGQGLQLIQDGHAASLSQLVQATRWLKGVTASSLLADEDGSGAITLSSQTLELLRNAATALEHNTHRMHRACELALTPQDTTDPVPLWRRRLWGRRRWLKEALNRRTEQASVVARVGIRQIQETTEVISGLASTLAEVEEIITMVGHVARDTNVLALDGMLRFAREQASGNRLAGRALEARSIALQTTRATTRIHEKMDKIRRVSDRTAVLMVEVARNIRRVGEVVGELAISMEQHGHAAHALHLRPGAAPTAGAIGLHLVARARQAGRPSPPPAMAAQTGTPADPPPPATTTADKETVPPEAITAPLSAGETLEALEELVLRASELRGSVDGLLRRFGRL